MRDVLTRKRSITAYQMDHIHFRNNDTVQTAHGFSSALNMASVSSLTYHSSVITSGFNSQASRYIVFNNDMQASLSKRTSDYMSEILMKYPDAKASLLRDKATFVHLKKFVTREELMKLQIGRKVDLPISGEKSDRLYQMIKDKDLTDITDKELNKMINDLIRPSDRDYITALKMFKETGKANDLLQASKLDRLKDELEDIDFSKITNKQYKNLKENYCNKPEYHHRESISNDPTAQSEGDNIDVLNTTEHDKRHTHNGKVDYRKPVKEPRLNRNSDIEKANVKRIFKNELKGLGIAVAIGAGIGFTVGFISSLAESGVSPDYLKNAFINGGKSSVGMGAQSAVSYGLGRTVGEVASKALQGFLGQNLGIEITENIEKMCNMAAVGAITIAVFSVVQFVILKRRGVCTKEALIQVGKQALFSLSILAVSIAAQGIWGGIAGIIVSVSIGIIVISYGVLTIVHDRHFAETIREKMISEYKHQLCV